MFAVRKGVKPGSVKPTYAIMLTYIEPVSLFKLITLKYVALDHWLPNTDGIFPLQ